MWFRFDIFTTDTTEKVESFATFFSVRFFDVQFIAFATFVSSTDRFRIIRAAIFGFVFVLIFVPA